MLKNLILGTILPLALVATGLGVLFGLKPPAPAKNILPEPVPEELLRFMPRAEVETVRSLDELSDTLNLRVTGTVVPFRELQIAAETAGKVIEKNPLARSGNYVEKGQVLYRIDPRDYELEVERITGKRDQDLASVRELQQDIENARSLLQVAEEEMKLAEAEVARFENLGKNFSSAAEFDQARRSRLASMNQKVNLQNQIRSLETQVERRVLAAKLSETELEQAELNLQRTVIRAPVSGRVVNEQVEADSYVQRGTAMVVIEDTEKVEVACNVRMDQLFWILDQPDISTDQLLTAAQSTQLKLPPTPVNVDFQVAGRENAVYRWHGVLDRYDGAGIDPQSRTVPIRIRVDDPFNITQADGSPVEASGPPMLVRGMFVDLEIQANPSTRLLLVPKLSIKPASNANVIWKFSPDPEAVFATPTAMAAIEASKSGETSKPAKEPSEEQKAAKEDAKLDPNDWETGFLTVVDGVRMVTSYWGDEGIEYWVCEVPAAELGPGDRVVVSPLPGVKADGTDPMRVAKKTEKIASEKETQE